MAVLLPTFKGLKDFLLGKQSITRADEIIQPLGKLPELLDVTIHECHGLYRPTYLSYIKMDPYIGVYLAGNKAFRLQTPVKFFGGSNAQFDMTLTFPFKGEPLAVIQAFAKEPIRDEFIGEVPLDLMAVLNSRSRSWSGPVTIYGQKGTITRGDVVITVAFRGGDPYDPSHPAMTRAQYAMVTGHGIEELMQPQRGYTYQSPAGGYAKSTGYYTKHNIVSTNPIIGKKRADNCWCGCW